MRGNLLCSFKSQNFSLKPISSITALLGLALLLVLIPAQQAYSLPYELMYEIEDAWDAHPDKAIYQRLKGAGKQEEAQALKRQALIHLTRTTIRDFMRDQERKLDDYVMNKIDEAILHTRGFNLPEPTRELFREEYKHQLYVFLLEYSYSSALSEMYIDFSFSVLEGEDFIRDIHQYTTRNASMLMRNLEQIAYKAMDEAFDNEEQEEYFNSVSLFNQEFISLLMGR